METFDYEKFSLIFGNDGIVRIIYKEGQHIKLDDVKLVVSEIEKRWSKEKYFALYSDIRGTVDFDRDARVHLAQSILEGLVANAVLLKGSIQKFIADLFVMIDKPTIATKFFNKEEGAIEWLKSLNPNN